MCVCASNKKNPKHRSPPPPPLPAHFNSIQFNSMELIGSQKKKKNLEKKKIVRTVFLERRSNLHLHMMKRLVIEYIKFLLRYPTLYILVPLVIIFTLSYNIVYDFTVKQLNSLFLYGVEKITLLPTICQGKYVTKLILKSENVLDPQYLAKVQEMKQHLSLYSNCIITPILKFELKRSVVRYFNEMNVLLAYLFLDNLTYTNHFIQTAKTLKIYLIHDGDIPVEGVMEMSKHFIDYFSIQTGVSKIRFFFLASDIIVVILVGLFILYLYLVLANSHRVKSNFRVLSRWLISLFLSGLASTSLITYWEGAASWNLVTEPLTSFTKLTYFLIIMVASSSNLFEALEIPGSNVHKRLLDYYTGFYCLPRITKNLFVNTITVCGMQLICMILVWTCFRGDYLQFISYRLSVISKEVLVCMFIEYLVELSFVAAIFVVDLKQETLNLEEQEGANLISSKLMKSDRGTLAHRLGLKLLTVSRRSNPIIVVSSGLVLMLVVLAHWTIIMPMSLDITIENSNTCIYYIEYSLLVLFIVAVLGLAVPTYNTEQLEFNETVKRFNTIDLTVSSDILRIATNPKTSHLVTTSLDHKVLYWSPLGDPDPIELSCDLWPINHLGINDDGRFVILVSFKKGVIKCFDRKLMKVKWIQMEDSLRSKPKILESFFRKRTVPGFLARKMLRKRRGSDASLSSVNSLVNANFPPPPPPIEMKSHSQEQRERKTNSVGKEEYVMVFQTGEILVVSCVDGSIKRYDVKESLINAKKIRTPRVPDRIVCLTSSADLIVVNIVNNNLKSKQLTIKKANPTSELSSTLNQPTIQAVEFVGFVVKVDGLECQVIDVISGNVVKLFVIGSMKPNTLKVSYPQPTHCRFCGSAAISSFSVMYENDSGDDEEGVIVVHTFRVDEMRKAICLRVERDPREIRCLGFSAADEKVNWFYNFVGYEVTCVNLIIGIMENTSTLPKLTNRMDSSIGLSSLRNRKIKKTNRTRKEFQLMLVSLGSGDTDYYKLLDYQNFNNLWSVYRYGYKSVILNLGNRLEIIYFGNNNLIEYVDDNSLKFNLR